MAGRPKSEELYRKKGSHNWYFYRKGFGTVDTGTTDRFKAEQLFRQMAPKQATTAQVIANPIESPDPVRSALQTLAERLPIGRPAEPRPITPEDFEAPVLNANEWQAHTVPQSSAQAFEPVQPKAFEPLPTGPQPLSQTAKDIGADTKYQALQTLKKRLTPGKRDKLMGVLAGGAAKVNALAVELGLSVTGRKLKDDFVFSEEDLEIVKTGYEMGLDELLGQADPEWWHLVLVGNVTMIVTMLPATEKKVKPPIDVTEGDSNGS